ncbi:xylosyltransferase oxt-like [Tubulanus polymorphus]|uniref:xylosyltransferase oxt-like n=1 Tax=Tubulanus polymorphus TaxID=672921 RepID=UPI003DA25EAE
MRFFSRYKIFFYIVLVIIVVQIYVGFYFINSTTTKKRTEEENGPNSYVVVDDGNLQLRYQDGNGIQIKPAQEIYRGKDDDKSNSLVPSRTMNFKPKCEITSKDALSALSRARTTQCKQEIADVACEAQRGTLYWKKLPRFCKYKDENEGQFLGCFKDVKSNRDLSAYNVVFETDNSPEKCIYTCYRLGYQYAGVQYVKECWCGDSFGRHGKLDEGSCNRKCPGSTDETCGGFLTQNIYATGVGFKHYHYANIVNPAHSNVNKWIRIAFILTLNGRAVRQVKRLFKAIYHVNHYYYIHVDSRQDYLYRELYSLTKDYHNVRFTRWRMSTIWGGASLLQMLLRCMNDLMNMNDWSWDFFLNLSESDFPIKTIDELSAFLTEHKDRNFVKCFGKKASDFIRKQGLDKTFYECDTHLWRLGTRDLPSGIRIDGGSDWVTLNRRFCEYVLSDADNLIIGLKQLFKYTLLPAESFFHTLLQNSKFCNTVVDNNLHLTNWRRKQGCKCQHKKVVDWCGCSPNDLKPGDFKKVLNTQPLPTYFARKFEAIVSQEIINQIDHLLYGREDNAQMSRVLDSYWQNEWHHLDTRKSDSDAKLSYFRAFMDLSLDDLKSDGKRCDVLPNSPLEMNVYSKADSVRGILLFYDVRNVAIRKKYRIETWLQEKTYYHLSDVQDEPAGRIKQLKVGTDFDPKEEIFRNFASIIGPYSEIVLVHSWGAGEKFTATFVWIDPTDRLIAAFDIAIKNKMQHTTVFNPNFQQPILPGVWKVRLLYQWKVVAETTFLVLPLATVHGIDVTPREAYISNSGHLDAFMYTGRNFSKVASFLGLEEHKNTINDITKNARIYGGRLRKYIAQLAQPYWSVKSSCYHGEKPPCSDMTACELSPWSSRYPDLKSELKPIDPLNGRIR